MKKVLLYGAGGDYDLILNSILLQIKMEKIVVQGIIVSPDYRYSHTKDGFNIFTTDDLHMKEAYFILIKRNCLFLLFFSDKHPFFSETTDWTILLFLIVSLYAYSVV